MKLETLFGTRRLHVLSVAAVATVVFSAMLCSAAHAGDVCLTDGLGIWKFTKARTPKAGTAAPLHGVYWNGPGMVPCPATGTAFTNSAGNELSLGVLAHCAEPFTGHDFRIAVRGSTDWILSGDYDLDDDGISQNAGIGYDLTPFPCNTMPVQP